MLRVGAVRMPAFICAASDVGPPLARLLFPLSRGHVPLAIAAEKGVSRLEIPVVIAAC
jgi:hypothetical protein